MFDIGFSELIIVFVVALLILGPERLPTAAKTAGLWVRKIRRTISSVQREINAQLDQEELQQKIEQTNQRIMKEGNSIQNMITSPEGSRSSKDNETGQAIEDVTPDKVAPKIESLTTPLPEKNTPLEANTLDTNENSRP